LARQVPSLVSPFTFVTIFVVIFVDEDHDKEYEMTKVKEEHGTDN